MKEFLESKKWDVKARLLASVQSPDERAFVESVEEARVGEAAENTGCTIKEVEE